MELPPSLRKPSFLPRSPSSRFPKPLQLSSHLPSPSSSPPPTTPSHHDKRSAIHHHDHLIVSASHSKTTPLQFNWQGLPSPSSTVAEFHDHITNEQLHDTESRRHTLSPTGAPRAKESGDLNYRSVKDLLDYRLPTPNCRRPVPTRCSTVRVIRER